MEYEFNVVFVLEALCKLIASEQSHESKWILNLVGEFTVLDRVVFFIWKLMVEWIERGNGFFDDVNGKACRFQDSDGNHVVKNSAVLKIYWEFFFWF